MANAIKAVLTSRLLSSERRIEIVESGSVREA